MAQALDFTFPPALLITPCLSFAFSSISTSMTVPCELKPRSPHRRASCKHHRRRRQCSTIEATRRAPVARDARLSTPSLVEIHSANVDGHTESAARDTHHILVQVRKEQSAAGVSGCPTCCELTAERLLHYLTFITSRDSGHLCAATHQSSKRRKT